MFIHISFHNTFLLLIDILSLILKIDYIYIMIENVDLRLFEIHLARHAKSHFFNIDTKWGNIVDCVNYAFPSCIVRNRFFHFQWLRTTKIIRIALR